MKVLVIRFSSIGDIVLTTPVVRLIKTQLDAEVHFLTKAKFESLLVENPYIDKIFGLEEKLSALLPQLKKERYDYVIDLHNNLRSQIVKRRLGVKSYSFNKLNWQKLALVKFKIDRMPNKHIVDRYVETLKPLGIKMDALGLDYFIPDKDEVDLTSLPATFQTEFYVFAFGGTYETKRLPKSKMIELLDRINKPVVLLGGPEDKELGDELVQFFVKDYDKNRDFEEQLIRDFGKKTIVYNGSGLYNLNQSASLIRQSSGVFAHDTGMMHVAAAFKKKVWSIWGNTVPEFGMYPYRTKFVIYEQKLSCRPCSKLGYNQCPKGHFKCMNNQTFDFWLP